MTRETDTSAKRPTAPRRIAEKSALKRTVRPRASSPSVRRRMQATRRRDTCGEVALRSALRSLGLRYRVDLTLPGTRRRVDIAFVREKLAVFVDGCFWHGCPLHGTWPKANAAWWREKITMNRIRDKDTNRRLKAAGWMTLRFWEHRDSNSAARRVVEVLKERTHARRHS